MAETHHRRTAANCTDADGCQIFSGNVCPHPDCQPTAPRTPESACDGSTSCEAPTHAHGFCFADRGQCDNPNKHPRMPESADERGA